VSVYKEAERAFAEGDRIQFRAPFTDKRIVNGELLRNNLRVERDKLEAEGSRFGVQFCD
jgi:hypothetical protein